MFSIDMPEMSHITCIVGLVHNRSLVFHDRFDLASLGTSCDATHTDEMDSVNIF